MTKTEFVRLVKKAHKTGWFEQYISKFLSGC